MKSRLLVLLLSILTLSLNAQDDDKGTIDAQRPTLTESYSIILPNMLQFESGVDYFSNSNSYSYGSFVRGAISKKIELRFFTDYESINTAGLKFVVMEPEKSSLGLGASFIYNRNFDNDSNDFRLALTKSFSKVFITYNFGYDNNIYNIFLLGIPISNRFNYFIEYYVDANINRIHTGFTWIPQRDIQVDINGGYMETEDFYVGLGFSFRLR